MSRAIIWALLIGAAFALAVGGDQDQGLYILARDTRRRKALIARIVDYIAKNFPRVQAVHRQAIAQASVDVAAETAVPLDVLLAIMEQESGFNVYVPKGAHDDLGLMQVTPDAVEDIRSKFGFPQTWDELRTPQNIAGNIRAGALYLKLCLREADRNGWDLQHAIGNYNHGAYNPDRNQPYIDAVLPRLRKIRAWLDKP